MMLAKPHHLPGTPGILQQEDSMLTAGVTKAVKATRDSKINKAHGGRGRELSLVLENWSGFGIKPTPLQNRMRALHKTISKSPHNFKEMQRGTADYSSSSLHPFPSARIETLVVLESMVPITRSLPTLSKKCKECQLIDFGQVA